MSEMTAPKPGSIFWADLTVPEAEPLRTFYGEVVGWNFSDHAMGDYVDYNVHAPETNDTVAGLCNARGVNADLPPQWLIYITVADLEYSIERCNARGGQVIAGPRAMGTSRVCVIRDPAGAVAALFEPAAG